MAILNHRDYRLARARLRQLERATDRKAVLEATKEGISAELSEARRYSIRTEIERIRNEINTYERLRDTLAKDAPPIEAEELGVLPIFARISQQLSQKQLSEMLGLKEQQVQRYERQRYRSISLDRYQYVLSVLGVEVHPRLSQKRPIANPLEDLDFELKPEILRDIRRRGWIDLPRSMSPSEMKHRINHYIDDSRQLSASGVLNRRSAPRSENVDAITELWRARIMRLAHDSRGQLKGKFNVADAAWLAQLVRLSVYADGPARAVAMLREHGIILVVEPHLPTTALDGAAFLLDGGIPVVALTLRHDRIDNFWFTLLHELAHIYLHFHRGLDGGFVDDLEESRISEIEQQADDFARNTLISDEVWSGSVARFTRSDEVVERFARANSIHPAIVAGRIRRERDYKLFPQLIGAGQVRGLFLATPTRD